MSRSVAPTVVDVDTEQGPGRLLISEAGHPGALLVLGHGAGGGIEGLDLVTLSRLLPDLGITVARYVQPWKIAGRRVAVRPALLDQAWTPAVRALREVLDGVPLVVGGHSAGARVACRTAEATGALAVLALSFPLHPPGRPASSRLPELLTPRVPVRVVQGERDPFGTPAEVREALALAAAGPASQVEVVEVPAAGHDLAPRRTSGVDAAQWWRSEAMRIAAWIGGIAGASHSL